MKEYLFRHLLLLALALTLFTACNQSFEFNSGYKEEEGNEETSGDDLNTLADRTLAMTKVADSLFGVCQTAAELERHAEELRAMKDVEYVTFNNDGMTLKMKDALPIDYIYPQYEDAEDLEAETSRMMEEATRALVTAHNSHNMNSLCIIDELSHSEYFSYVNSWVDTLECEAKSLGMTVKVLPHKLLPSFFISEAFEYDMLLLLSHGGYDEKTGEHTFFTSHEYGTRKMLEESWYDQERYEVKMAGGDGMADNYLRLGCIMERHTYSGETSEEKHYYLGVKDKYIEKLSNGYSGERFGKGIIFSAACKSLKDNDNLANAFRSKGAACYLGYNETQSVGVKAGCKFFHNLLAGRTIESAFAALPANLCSESWPRKGEATGNARRWTAQLLPRYNNNVENVRKICARCVYTLDADIAEFESSTPNEDSEESQNVTILTGAARLLDATQNTYGFIFGKKADLSDGVKLVELSRYREDGKLESRLSFDSWENTVTFHYVFQDGELMDGKSYYYRAYMRDPDGYYCYGEIKALEAEGLIKGELGLFELKGPVKSYTFKRAGETETTTRTFDRNGFWLTYNGITLRSIYNMGITRDLQGRITKGEFDEGYETYEYDARGRIVKYGYLYYDGGNGITYHYDQNGLLYQAEDEPWGMDAEYYDTEVYNYKGYVLDKYGNWIQRLCYTKFSGYDEQRTIEYYE